MLAEATLAGPKSSAAGAGALIASSMPAASAVTAVAAVISVKKDRVFMVDSSPASSGWGLADRFAL